jgi:hypothetical protein
MLLLRVVEPGKLELVRFEHVPFEHYWNALRIDQPLGDETLEDARQQAEDDEAEHFFERHGMHVPPRADADHAGSAA